MSNFPIIHGLTLAQNAFIENLRAEVLAADPVPVAAGRIWYNSTDKAFRYSAIDGTGAVVVKSFYDADTAQAALAALTSDYIAADAVVASNAEAYADARKAEAITYADQIKTDLLGGIPPDTLDTITEIATALRDNPNIIDVLETKIGTDITAAKDELKGTVTTAMDTLGEIEDAINTEVSDRTAADTALDGRITSLENATGAQIGDLSTLTTDEQGTIVGAINEVDANVDTEVAARAAADQSIRDDYNGKRFTFASSAAAVTHTVTHSLGADFVNFTVLVQRADGSWRNDVVSVEVVDNNTLKVYLSVASQVKVAVESLSAI